MSRQSPLPLALPELTRPLCQYEALPVQAVPPLNLLRPARRAREHLRRRYEEPPTAGKPSRFRPGEWVRVRDAEEIRATLDEQNRHRGLWFTDGQWDFCGRVLQVEHVVRQMLDDHYRLRRVSGTVTLHGGSCQGPEGGQGCGLACALLFRDEWLTPATGRPPTKAPAQFAVVRPLDAIRATLDGSGRLHGVVFHEAMGAYAGTRHGVAGRVHQDTLPWWQQPVGEWFLLDTPRCGGEPLAELGQGCDRQCALLWHRSWLDFEA